jgi:hypothetical protein
LNAVAGLRADEVIAAGDDSTLYRFNGSTWVTQAGTGDVAHVRAAYAADANTLYLGGSGSTGAPAIVRLVRH